MRRLALMLLLALAAPAAAQDHTTFKMIRPVATGAAGTGLDSANHVYKAYTGIEWSINATARGGEYPYTYALSNAPAGMSIVAGPCTVVGPTCEAGKITWTSPTGTASNIVVTVTDRDGDQVTGTWTVVASTTACGTTGGWCFVDSVNGNDTTGNGSLATPWASLAKVWNTVSAADNTLYFRTGTYVTTGMTTTAPLDCGLQVAWNEATRPVAWIGYPGETANINFASDGGARVACMEFTGQNILLDHLTISNIGSMGFQFSNRTDRYGIVARYITGAGLKDGEDQQNASYFMWSNASSFESYYDTVQNSTFDGVQGDGGVDDDGDPSNADDGAVMKMYSMIQPVIENNSIANDVITEAAIAIKAGIEDYTVRGNICAASVLTCIGGNMNILGAVSSTRGEVHHNNCKGSGTGVSQGCLTIGASKVNTIGAVYVYRNTFQGTVTLKNVVTADGPYTFTRNVVVNSGGSVSPTVCANMRDQCITISDSARIVDSGNSLDGAAADNIIDAAGDLQGTYLTNFGPSSGTPTGHMMGAAEAPADAPTVTLVTPSTGSTAGGDTLVIAGTNFVTGATVTVGGVSCSGASGTSTSLSCTSGAHAAGLVNVIVTNPDTQAGTGTGLYTYVTPPTPTTSRTRMRGRMRAEAEPRPFDHTLLWPRRRAA